MRSLFWWTILVTCRISTYLYSRRYAAFVNIKQFFGDKCAIYVKVSSELTRWYLFLVITRSFFLVVTRKSYFVWPYSSFVQKNIHCNLQTLTLFYLILKIVRLVIIGKTAVGHVIIQNLEQNALLHVNVRNNGATSWMGVLMVSAYFWLFCAGFV